MLLIRRMMSGTYAHPEFNDTPDYVRTHSNKVQIHAMGVETEPKRRFIPSKWERQKVMKIVKGIREGRIKINEKKEPKQEEYLLWGDDNTTGEEQGKGKGPPSIQAPKLTLPGHNASVETVDNRCIWNVNFLKKYLLHRNSMLEVCKMNYITFK
jgi:ribosome biogenesis protein ERB1